MHAHTHTHTRTISGTQSHNNHTGLWIPRGLRCCWVNHATTPGSRRFNSTTYIIPKLCNTCRKVVLRTLESVHFGGKLQCVLARKCRPLVVSRYPWNSPLGINRCMASGMLNNNSGYNDIVYTTTKLLIILAVKKPP